MAPDEERVRAWRAVLLAQSRALRAIERDLEQAGTISLQWYDVLLELNALPDGLRMQDLALRTVVSRTRVSRIVSELEEHGLVERVIDPGDARASVATITAAGRQELRRAAPVYLAGIDAHFNRYLTVPQRTAVASALQRVVDAHAEQIDPRR
ncbi:MAG TPA: helix-turn-helix domain-containing protein [Ilumatobacter sp.]